MKAVVFFTDDTDIPEFARISGIPEDIIRGAQRSAQANDQYPLFQIELKAENVVQHQLTAGESNE